MSAMKGGRSGKSHKRSHMKRDKIKNYDVESWKESYVPKPIRQAQKKKRQAYSDFDIDAPVEKLDDYKKAVP